MKNTDKLRKLAELVKRGIGGEAKNAEGILKKLLEKEGITLDEFLNSTEDIKEYSFRYWTEYDAKILKQLYSMIKDTRYIEWSKVKRVKELWFSLTTSEYVEMKYLYDIYRGALYKELQRETEAFIIKNQIYHKTTSKYKDEPTLEELEEWRKIYAKLGGTNFVQIHKAIESKS